jgi:hypothetical protein
VDNKATSITSGDLSSPDNTPAVNVTFDEKVTQIVFNINDSSYAGVPGADSATWGVPDNTIPTLKDSTYVVSVIGTDLVGNPFSGNINLTVDVTIPQVTVDTLVTSIFSPEITGTVSDTNAVVTVTIGDESHEASVSSDGTWRVLEGTFDALSTGTYDVRVSAVNDAGEGTDFTVNELIITTVYPIVSIADLLTNDSTPSLTGTINDPSARCTVFIGGQTVPVVNNGDSTWTLVGDGLSALSEDSLVAVVTATNHLGNQSVDTGIIVVDLTPPQVLGFIPQTGEKVSLRPMLLIMFEEDVFAGVGSIELWESGGDAPLEILLVGTNKVTGFGMDHVELAPAVTLELDKSYFVLVDPGCILDRAGNPYAGITDSTMWKFFTPSVEDPVIDSITVGTPSGLYKEGDTIRFSFYFSQPVQLEGGNLNIRLETGAADRVVRISPFTIKSVLPVSYVVQTGDATGELKVLELSLEPGAVLKNIFNRDLVLSVEQGKNLSDYTVIRLDGVPPQVQIVQPSSSSAVYQPAVSYILGEDVSWGAISWHGGYKDGGYLPDSVRSDTALGGRELEAGEHEVLLPVGPLVRGASYVVVVTAADSAGNVRTAKSDLVRLVSDIAAIRVKPSDTTVMLGTFIQFSAAGVDVDGTSEFALDTVVWSVLGQGVITQQGTFMVSGLGESFIIAQYGSMFDTATVTADSGRLTLPQGGDSAITIGRDVELIFPPLPLLTDTVMEVGYLDASGHPRDMLLAGPAVVFPAGTDGEPWSFESDVTLRLKIDTSMISVRYI